MNICFVCSLNIFMTLMKDDKKAFDFLFSYRYSSYLDYFGKERAEKSILSKKEFPEYFSDHRDFKDFINDYLFYEPT